MKYPNSIVCSLALLFSLWTYSPAKADIGQTFDLKAKREMQLKTAQNDSLFPNNIFTTDSVIFNSYDETINRIEEGEKLLENRLTALVMACGLALLLLGLCVYTLYVLNSRINEISGEDKSLQKTISEIFTSILFLSLPSKQVIEKTRGIHFIIFICLIGMLVSMIGYLAKLAGL